MAEGVQDLLIVAGVTAAFTFGWWKTKPMEVYKHVPKSDTVLTEPYDSIV